MLEELCWPLDSETLLRRRVALRRQLLAQDVPWLPKRIAVLGGSTTHDIVSYLELFLLQNGIRPTFYESDYAQFRQDALFGNEEFDAFAPDVIVLHTSLRNITAFPAPQDTPEQVTALLDAEYARFETLWETLSAKCACPILQSNFELPPWRLLGNADAWDIHGRTWFVTELNRRFALYAQSHPSFLLNDVCWLSAAEGLDRYANLKHWYLYKSSADLALLPQLAFNIANIIKALFGKNKKALVLDLDNTLWGGVIGDDGVEGIAIAPDDSEGQAYREFQQYLKDISALGVLLNINSKNEEENALAGLRHPDGVLRPEDFVSIEANWRNKDENLSDIAAALNLGADSLVFVDDNPVERGAVRASFPQVAAPPLARVEDYIRTLDRSGYFESVGISADDLRRGEMYRANLRREGSREQFADYTEYLRSLQMEAVIAPFSPLYFQRITQLTNKTNQFNLTCRRCTQSEIERMAESGEYLTLYGRLRDKYGDNGLVSVLAGKREGDTLTLELFLMSCRVLKRGMEQAMLNALALRARAAGCALLRGVYLPSAKNAMVSQLYGTLGFTPAGTAAEGGTLWELPLADFSPLPCQIQTRSQEDS